MPSVSVIIPAYNAEKFIAETLTSVLAQTLPDVEVIVVDDGSRDGTADVVQRFPSVRYVRKPNGGVSAARNMGVSLAQSAYIAFLDADDIWHPDKLRQQLQALSSHPDSVLSCTRITNRETDRAAFDTRTPPQDAPHRLYPDLSVSFLEPYLATSTVMVRKSAFDATGGFDTSLRIAEDVDFYLRVLAKAPHVVYMSETLVFKRPVEGSLGDDSAAGYVQLLKVYDRFLAQHPQARADLGEATVNEAYYRLHMALARSHLWVGQPSQARAAALQAMKFGPKLPAWQLVLKSLVPAALRDTLGSRRHLPAQ